MQAFNNDDLIQIFDILWIRNEITHELLKWIIDDRLPPLNKEQIIIPILLHQKISNWWIKNFEASIMPENYEKFTEHDMNSATVMTVQTLSALVERALPD